MADFKVFGDAVRMRFKELADEPLFEVDREKEAMWEHYLASFPAGSNPIFRVKTEHDCSCCRHFMRDIGNVVAIQNGALATVWDLNGLPEPYQTVADAMSAYVKSRTINGVFLSKFNKVGTAANPEQLENGKVLTWNHFSCDVPKKHVSLNPEPILGEKRTSYEMLIRAVKELKPEAVATTLDLIQSNAIYRGAEFKNAVEAFKKVHERFLSNPVNHWPLIGWAMVDNGICRFKNTVIGSLVTDLSSDVSLEDAVRMYESKVAPENYKRPTALITKAMIEEATKKIEELGLEAALERRHARLEDVSVNSVLFVDNSVQEKMKGGIKGLLMQEVKPAPFDVKKAEEISIYTFQKLLPTITGLKLYLDNSVLNNFVSMTAPVHESSGRLLRWDNDFAWSYDGNVADSSIKQKVKAAGGKVEGVNLRVSLAWHNHDDLDLHCREPNGNHVYYGFKDGKLDVDMNAGSGHTREPVENMRWAKALIPGDYRFAVNQFRRRESTNVGFEIEIEFAGGLYQLRCPKSPSSGADQAVGVVTVGKTITFKLGRGMEGGAISQDKWGLKSLELAKVNSVVLSPNFWDENAVGNKHWFFILDGCMNPDPTRGFYNEFLSPELEPHRKVFEVLADKTKCPVVPDQMSGVGFSSTRKDKVTVMAMGPNLNKPFTIVF